MSPKPIFVVAVCLAFAGCHAETFTASGPSAIEVLHGPPALVSLGTELDTLLQVRVVDADGHPQGGVPVTWRIVDGDGELIPAGATTGPEGLATARWKFGMIPGSKRAQVEVSGLDPVTFTTEARGFRAVQVTAGYTHACAIDAGGAAWCWNADSVVRGAPGSYNSIRPTPVLGGQTFVEVRAGDDFTCGRNAVGEAWCWGHPYGLPFGPGITTDQTAPFHIVGLPGLRLLRTGSSHACGIAADSTAWCWGNNVSGQAGGIGSSVAPTQLGTALKFVDLALGSGQSCGLTPTGDAYCWGAVGMLGDGGPARIAPTTPVAGNHRFVELKAGDSNTCGRTGTGEVWCWGVAEDGSPNRSTPVRLALPTATSVSVAFDYVAVTTMGGGTRFASTFGSEYSLPVEIQQLGVAQFAGRGSFCLISRSGDVYCSGSIVDQGSCSSVSPYGCAPAGPIPLPAGGRVYGYPPFGD